MSRILLCSDLHLGHKNIHKYRMCGPWQFADEGEHRCWLMNALRDAFQPKDHIIVAGDVAFTREALAEFKQLPGRKTMIRGNHDNFTTREYLEVFEEVYGLWCWKSFWFSHAPIHPDELRGRVNLHGHVHTETIKQTLRIHTDFQTNVDDRRYFNLCPENLVPIFGRPWCTLEEARSLRPRTKDLEQK
jgi:calcineurin-like phosphoesterase family protein